MKLFLQNKHRNKKTGKAFRMLSILLVMVLLLSLTVPAYAVVSEENTPKQEVVYINLNPDGSVKEIYVVNIFELDKDGQIIDYGDYTALRNMTSNDEIQFENEKIKIDTKAGKLYYEGKLNKNAIPWKFSIKYYMDNKEYTADKIAGKSGKFKLSLSIRKNPDCNSTFFENYALQASVTLDTDICKNISAEDATGANVGRDRQLTYTIFPDSEKDILITADVTDFEMDGISINGIPLSMSVDIDDDKTAELTDELSELTDAVAELDDGAVELRDGASDLKDGAKDLKDGAEELDDGTGDLYDGVRELKDGTSQLYNGSGDLSKGVKDLLNGSNALLSGTENLKSGAKQLSSGVEDAASGALSLYEGAKQLKSGISSANTGVSSLYSGLSQLSSNSEALRNGAYEIFTQLTSTAQTQLNNSLAEAGFEAVSLTPENYDAVITELLNVLSNGAYSQAEAAAEEEIKTQVEAVVIAQIEDTIRTSEKIMAQIDAGVEAQYGEEISNYAQSIAVLEFAKTMSPENPEQWLQTSEGQNTAAAFLSSEQGQQAVAAARGEVKKQYVEAAIEGQTASQMQSEEVQTQINDAVEQQLASEEVQKQISDAVSAALSSSEAYQGIITLKNQLDNYQIFYNALVQYTQGVDSAANGSLELKGGLSELLNGAEQLESGSKELYAGLQKLKDGSAELLDGTITLHNGAVELNDGIVKLNDGSMDVLNGVAELNDGSLSLYDGIVTLKDGTAQLSSGAIKMYDGTIELYDGTIELTDGTFEFRQETSDLDVTMKDKLTEAVDDMLGGDFDVISFVSEKNTNVDSVQFVIKTDSISADDEEEVVKEEPKELNLWEKLLKLFGLYNED